MGTNGNLINKVRNTFGNRWVGLLIGGLSVGTGVYYLLKGRVAATRDAEDGHYVDDRGTGQKKASRILTNLRDRAFESDDEKLALALGRPAAEVAAWQSGAELIDDDVIMKARGIAMHRGVRVE